MDYNWDKIKRTLKKEIQPVFDDPIQPNYPFSFDDGLDLFCKTLMLATGEDSLDGIEVRVIPTIYKYYHTPKDKNDSFNYLTQLVTRLDSFFQKIVFLFHHSDYLAFKSQNRGLFYYLRRSGINVNNIDFRQPLSSIPTNLLSTSFGAQLYDAYNLRNQEAHSANDFTDIEISKLINSTLVIYLFTTFEYYNQLLPIVGNLVIPEYIKTTEIVKELTPSGEYEIDLLDVFGRNNDLFDLKQKVEDISNVNKIIALRNIGGVGKTTLLKAYVKNNKIDYNYIIWIPFQNDLISSFTNNIVLYENLGISLLPNISPFENYKLLMNNISKLSGKTLLLIDDLQEDTTVNYSNLPLSINCNIIATTRLRLANSLIKIVDIGFLDFASSKELFLKYFSGTVNDTQLTILFDLISFHTLTIELLAKTLETNFTIDGVNDLIEYLKNDSISNEDWQVAIPSEYDDENVNLKNHLLKAFSLIPLSSLETQILSHFSILPTLQYDGKELVKLFSIEKSQMRDFAEALDSLVRKGWIIKTANLYQMHAIIQEIIKIKIPPKFNNNLKLVEGLISYLSVKESISISQKTKYITCSQHILEILTDEEEEINVLTGLVAIGLNTKGDFSNALKYAEKSLNHAKKSKDDHKVYQAYSTLGMINRGLGNYKKSLEYYETAIDLIESLPEKYIHSLHIYSNLATLLEQLGELRHLNRAKEIYETVIDELTYFLENNEHEKHYLVFNATTLNSLGKIYTLLGKYENAIKIQQKAYDDLIKLLGNNHEIIGICACNLGLVYGYNNDFENSLKYHKISLSIQETVLDENHPEVAISKSGLANAYRNIGEIAKAKALFKEILELGERNLPEKHPTLARRKANYAVLCDSDSEKEMAKKLYYESIEIDISHHGDKIPDVGISNMNLAILFMKEEDWQSAYKHLQIANEIFAYNKTNNQFSSTTLEHIKFVQYKIASL